MCSFSLLSSFSMASSTLLTREALGLQPEEEVGARADLFGEGAHWRSSPTVEPQVFVVLVSRRAASSPVVLLVLRPRDLLVERGLPRVHLLRVRRRWLGGSRVAGAGLGRRVLEQSCGRRGPHAAVTSVGRETSSTRPRSACRGPPSATSCSARSASCSFIFATFASSASTWRCELLRHAHQRVGRHELLDDRPLRLLRGLDARASMSASTRATSPQIPAKSLRSLSSAFLASTSLLRRTALRRAVSSPSSPPSSSCLPCVRLSTFVLRL
jgi:hypothetical protein